MKDLVTRNEKMAMKFYFIACIGINILFGSCMEKPKTKLFIKSVKIPNGDRIDWYVYSSISNFAPDYLQISSSKRKPFFTSFYLTDILFKNDSLYVSLWNKNYDLDKSMLKGINISIDTMGKQWNQASSRIGRLTRRGINIRVPHFIDTYCPNGECE